MNEIGNFAGQHPGSAILDWWKPAVKDEEGYAKLSELVDVLNISTRIRGPSFLEEASKPEWEERYGWRLELHPWKANRIRVKKAQSSLLAGSPCFSIVESEEEGKGESGNSSAKVEASS